MPVTIVTFPEATPGCTCATCVEIREADRERKRARLDGDSGYTYSMEDARLDTIRADDRRLGPLRGAKLF